MGSQSQEVNISLERSPASARLAPPTPEVSGSLSAPASPSVTSPEKAEEMSPPGSVPVTSKSNDDLESENARLKEQRTRKICMDKEVGVVFLPCGHLCCCVLCAPSLRDCPVCRRNIQGTVRTFMS